MFESMSIESLQEYWWIIISILGAALVFLMFVQGGQTLIYTLGKTEPERTLIVNSLGRKWEFTFTTLVTFGGAFFASFPLFYSTSFGGAYWVWMTILFCFIVQAVSFEFRSKPRNIFGAKTFETFLFINGALGTILIGTAVGTFFTGANFSVNKMRLTETLSSVTISRWEHPWHGLEAVLNVQNVLLGLTVFFLARTLALLYFMNNIGNDQIYARCRKQLAFNAIPFLIFFLAFAGMLLTGKGFAVTPRTGSVYMESFKYLHNLLNMPVVLFIFVIGVLLVLFGIAHSLIRISSKGIWFAGPGTFLTVFALFLIAGLNNTAYYPSQYDLQSSLTIHNSSSSHYTLTVMGYVSLMVPFVILYIIYAWRSINKTKLMDAEMNEETHIY
ncbi:MAG: cytochrome d ubiquinol oxidase subunit II [Bacteroidota bacterium]|nr:cytochrome d ubiquinol oxidase subunit II [Bacteroidota bacterium]